MDAAESQDHVDISHYAWNLKPGIWRAKKKRAWPSLFLILNPKNSPNEQLVMKPEKLLTGHFFYSH